MVPQIRESAHYINDQDWLSRLGPERRFQQQKDFNNNFNDINPPSYILVQHRRVVFDEKVDVHEVDQIDKKYYNSVWFTESELTSFEKKYIERTSRKRSQERDSRAYNHVRRVLCHHKACKQMGDYDMNNGLEYISTQSSENGKKLSLQDAARVEEEVQRYYKDKSSKSASRKNRQSFEYYMNILFDLYGAPAR